MAAKQRRKRVKPEEKATILRLFHAEQMTKAEVSREVGRTQSLVGRIIRCAAEKDVVLAKSAKTVLIKRPVDLTIANMALQKANGSPLTVGSINLIDLLASKAPEVVEVRLKVRERKVYALLQRELEFEV